MKPDTFTRTPEDAAAYEQIRGRTEDSHDRTFVEVRRACFVCQNATRSNFVCGPCRRVIDNGIDQASGYTEDERDRMRTVVELEREAQAVTHEHYREEVGRVVRVACSCGWRGRWRSRIAHLLEKQLHSDDGEHLYVVRRGDA